MALKVLVGNSSHACFVSVRIINDDREDEMEENLDEVSNHLTTLKSMALDFHDKIEKQNQKIGDIADKV